MEVLHCQTPAQMKVNMRFFFVSIICIVLHLPVTEHSSIIKTKENETRTTSQIIDHNSIDPLYTFQIHRPISSPRIIDIVKNVDV